MTVPNRQMPQRIDSLLTRPDIPMAQELQQHLLNILGKESEIKDTRSIHIPGESGPASSQDAQLLIQGALNSLLSREVCGVRQI